MSLKRLLVLFIMILAVPFVVSAAIKGEKIKSKSTSKVTKTEITKSKSADVNQTETIIKSSSKTSDINEITPLIIPTHEETVVNTPRTTPNAGETISWQVISSGGTNATSTSYQLLGTLGQTAVGMASSTGYQLLHGFWQDFGGIVDPSCCGQYTGGYPGNTNSDITGLRDLADITKLIDNVYISKLPLICPENGNVNGDGSGLVDLADITKLIDHVYISKIEVPVCI